ncbi:MAG: M48 family metallopeptidase [Moritella sp.]|uniref:M48 family metallopeptidase n=1 Tax=Moritella sp. TaxID=78556 RepID=UPI0025FCA2F4|nr:M48 family metallopeptidase [Moritella sp.]NQZ92208.1 M48 family metallopeptidase [Moritella sp.]
MFKQILPLVVLSSLVVGCTASPTGRNQVLLYSSSDMTQLGAQSFEQIKQQEKINTDPKLNNYVQCIADTLTHYVAQPTNWDVVIFDSPQVNAFALPGGHIGVYTGLLKVAKTPSQLAAVMGHEIVHVTANHSNERLSQSKITNFGLQMTDYALENQEYRETAMQALGLGLQYGVVLPYGRTQESEADVVGLELMAKAGFDPEESVALWRNMAAASDGKQPPEFLSTHPSHDTRIKALRKAIAKLPAEYRRPKELSCKY